MASILTNAGSMAALQTLRGIEKNMSTTQGRISSGLKVAEAKDNASYWSISTTMKSESSSLRVVGEALGMGASMADVSSTAVKSLIDLMGQVRDRVVAAGESTNDKEKILTELGQLYSQMESTVELATFNKVNWLTGEASGVAIADDKAKILSGVNEGAVSFIDVELGDNTSNVKAIIATVTALSNDTNLVDEDAINASLGVIDDAIAALTEKGAVFGAASTRISMQKEFISSLTDAIDRGVGALVDADMSAESTRLQALQAQQQLAVQSLSIANQNTQLILQLFR